MNRPLIIILLLAMLALGWWRLHPAEDGVRRTRLLMGTVVEIVAQGADAQDAVDAAFAEMVRLEKLLSRHVPESDVSRISASETGGEVTPETAQVIALGLEIAAKSGGAFDLTLGRLKSLWKIEDEAPTIPSQSDITKALAGIGPHALQLDGQLVRKRQPQLLIDLGGIAKGFIVDRAVDVLKAHGIASAAVNAGGDMYLLGSKAARPWRIGIQHPRSADAILATVEVSDRAVVTSGDYERYFERDGVRYHHIFDPKTGQPARRCQSVTIIADSVALGDALATAVFVLGPQQGLELLKQFPQTEGLIVAADDTLHKSPGWDHYEAAP